MGEQPDDSEQKEKQMEILKLAVQKLKALARPDVSRSQTSTRYMGAGNGMESNGAPAYRQTYGNNYGPRYDSQLPPRQSYHGQTSPAYSSYGNSYGRGYTGSYRPH